MSGSRSLKAAPHPQRAVQEAVKVRMKVQWRPKDVRDARNVERL
jgi:hypothetical protein